MRCIDILHKQVSHIIVLLIEYMKTFVYQHKETQAVTSNKRMFILQQATKIG